ncbi:MAG TPA: DUF4259 domain-containing protein [Bacteroidia bacterium]|jgi:hypothetical protein|nr:DUF4259 domain-containing protein [Bacteroidia bacterium]
MPQTVPSLIQTSGFYPETEHVLSALAIPRERTHIRFRATALKGWKSYPLRFLLLTLNRHRQSLGAWGAGSFENDSGTAWVSHFRQVQSVWLVEKSILSCLSPHIHLYTDACCQAIAACEVIAALQGHTAEDFPPALHPLCSRIKPLADPNLNLKAIAVLERIQDHSELRDLWEQADELNAWKRALEELRERLR